VFYTHFRWDKLTGADPNIVGDFLAGAFAPLAFMWLVAAVFLQRNELQAQRQELSLQRQELKETREVLAQQKAEMQRAADENLEQTKIMKQNLANEAIRSEYDQLDTLLYATALFIYTNRNLFKFRDRNQNNYEYIPEQSIGQFQISKISFDGIYVVVLNSLRRAIKIVNGSPSEYSSVSDQHEQAARDVYSRLQQIRALYSDANPLSKARLEGLSILELTKLFRAVQRFELPE